MILIEPASKVSVPPTVVMRTRSRAAARETSLEKVVVVVPSLKAPTPENTHALLVIFMIEHDARKTETPEALFCREQPDVKLDEAAPFAIFVAVPRYPVVVNEPLPT
jgi:hypothetical protein